MPQVETIACAPHTIPPQLSQYKSSSVSGRMSEQEGVDYNKKSALTYARLVPRLSCREQVKHVPQQQQKITFQWLLSYQQVDNVLTAVGLVDR